MKIFATKECDKCELTFIEDELTECVHYETGKVLGHLCDLCVEEWLKHLDTLDQECDDDV